MTHLSSPSHPRQVIARPGECEAPSGGRSGADRAASVPVRLCGQVSKRPHAFAFLAMTKLPAVPHLLRDLLAAGGPGAGAGAAAAQGLA